MSAHTRLASTVLAAMLALARSHRVEAEHLMALEMAADVSKVRANVSSIRADKLTITLDSDEKESPEVSGLIGGSTVDDEVTLFAPDDIAQGMAKPNPAFAKHLQYIIWMDQAGQYAPSNGVVPKRALPDALVLFAQPNSNINSNGWQKVKTCGGGWSWFWTDAGKEEYAGLRKKKGACHNWMQWHDAERTKANFYGLFGKVDSFQEKWLVNIGLELMPYWDCQINGARCEEAARISCPATSVEERWKCAMWKRPNHYAKVDIGTYYVFPVVDPEGFPVEPYFSEFRKAMETNKYFEGVEEKLQFVGTHEHDDWD